MHWTPGLSSQHYKTNKNILHSNYSIKFKKKKIRKGTPFVHSTLVIQKTFIAQNSATSKAKLWSFLFSAHVRYTVGAHLTFIEKECLLWVRHRETQIKGCPCSQGAHRPVERNRMNGIHKCEGWDSLGPEDWWELEALGPECGGGRVLPQTERMCWSHQGEGNCHGPEAEENKAGLGHDCPLLGPDHA